MNESGISQFISLSGKGKTAKCQPADSQWNCGETWEKYTNPTPCPGPEVNVEAKELTLSYYSSESYTQGERDTGTRAPTQTVHKAYHASHNC